MLVLCPNIDGLDGIISSKEESYVSDQLSSKPYEYAADMIPLDDWPSKPALCMTCRTLTHRLIDCFMTVGTFLPPYSPIDLFARPNIPDAWGKYNITTGYVSEIDLYRDIFKNAKDYLAVYNDIDSNELVSIGTALNDCWEAQGPRSDIPVFGSEDLMLDKDSPLYESICAEAIQIVQEEGEMVMIPPGWWHQVYHLEPSIAIASQYCNDANKVGVYEHILDYCSSSKHASKSLSKEGILKTMNRYSSSPTKEINSLLEAALMLQLGDKDGKMAFDSLTSKTK